MEAAPAKGHAEAGLGTAPALVVPTMDVPPLPDLSLIVAVLLVAPSLLHELYAALFARLGLVNRRLLTWEDPATLHGADTPRHG